ncbi:MAG: aspartyl protease family protein [Paludibacteraceae bacterium]
MKKFQYILFLLFLVIPPTFSKSKRVASIPFRMAGSYILIETSINGSTTLNFVLDTGLKGTMITGIHSEDSVSLPQGKIVSIRGLGLNDSIQAYQSRNNLLKIGNLKFPDKDILVLTNNLIDFSSITGEKINGILGAEVLKDYIIEINYTRQRINFYLHDSFTVPGKYARIPAIVVGGKMYINANVTSSNVTKENLAMLIDTGAEIGAWFQTVRDDAFIMPDKKIHGYIGEGLNGEIHGYYAVVDSLWIGPYCLKNPIVTFPDSVYIVDFIMRSSRDGTLGNQIMKRFDSFIDFKTPALYLKPNRMFADRFSFNIAGIEMIQNYPFFFEIRVNKVWKNSTADLKGIKPEDLILEVDRQPAFTMKLTEIRKIFETSRKRPLHVVIQRGDDVMDFFLDMKSPI